jgi:hypothetical protein
LRRFRLINLTLDHCIKFIIINDRLDSFQYFIKNFYKPETGFRGVEVAKYLRTEYPLTLKVFMEEFQDKAKYVSFHTLESFLNCINFSDSEKVQYLRPENLTNTIELIARKGVSITTQGMSLFTLIKFQEKQWWNPFDE